MKDGVAVEQYSESYSVTISTTSVESTKVIRDNTLDMQTAVVELEKQQSRQDVAESTEKTYENSPVVSENHNEFSAVGNIKVENVALSNMQELLSSTMNPMLFLVTLLFLLNC